jgi:hypothetical protein
MRIGIITQPLQANYGGLLQNYALQQILIREGHDVETIDWDKNRSLKEILYRVKVVVLSKFYPHKYQKPRYWLTGKEKAIIQRETNRFISTYINRTDVIHTQKGFKAQSDKRCYDAYVVGSDQCWRPLYNAFLPAMFLNFTEGQDVKRISYAASLGTDKWEFSPEQTALCTPLARKFDLVTVREDSGVKLCKEHFGLDAVQVLDPTLLLTKEDYISLIEADETPKSSGTLFSYILDPNKTISSFIQKVADELCLTPFQVLPKFQAENRTREDVKTHIEDCVYPRVTIWLRAFMDAEMVIVDSFHGMVFAIIFNKSFWVIGNAGRGMSRFISLLKIFHLEDRLLDVGHLENVNFNQSIDWRMVNSILEGEREKCKFLLLSQLKK